MSHAQTTDKAQNETAILAGGCFWCMQSPYDHLDGVITTTVGYAGGHTKKPTYEEVSAGTSGHYEAIKIVYDPQKVSFEKILDIFWQNIDPFDATGQFCDKGQQYRAVIFFQNETQEKSAKLSKEAIEKKLGKKVVTEILPFKNFYAAEEYHQKYYEKNPVRYTFYRYNCGRDERLKEVWGNKEKHE